jgi:Ca-activated chloride channel homolog
MRLSLLTLAISLSLVTGCSPTRPSAVAGGTTDDRKHDEGSYRTVPAEQAKSEADATTAMPVTDASAPEPARPPSPHVAPAPATLVRGSGQINASDISSVESATVLTAEQIAKVGTSPAANRLAESKAIAPSLAGGILSYEQNTEKYLEHADDPIQLTAENPVSTFSIDVDTGSYSNVRRMLMAGQRPPADSVRAEEMINYFDYGYAGPANRATPFRVSTEIAPAPWNGKHRLLQVGIQGYDVDKSEIPASNLVFLIDTSGSMEAEDKLPLLKRSFGELVKQLRPQDRVSIVVYAGSAGLVLAPTGGDRKDLILAALDRLSAGGSTNGGEGIELAYAMARRSLLKNGVNRVILATDGDFNVGTTDQKALETLVGDQRKSGIALTTLGFGTGNYNDAMAERLADIGDGNHAYIDSINEGRKVMVEEMSSTLLTIAQDVKIQMEFNPAVVAEYRLIGYENRALRREDFNNDQVDAGEIGAGHDVTALYEITLVGAGGESVTPLRYRRPGASETVNADEIGWLRLRYKQPGGKTSQLIESPLKRSAIAGQPSPRLRWSAAVAAYADLLRGGKNVNGFGWDQVAALARSAPGQDRWGYRAEFLQLVDRARTVTQGSAPVAISE